jgi:multiple sugar transport system substrate-binding protein
MKSRVNMLLVVLAVLLFTSVVGVQAQDVVQIRYSLWDAAQQPSYEECATLFEAENPNIDVVIEQLGWADYWTGIQTGFISGDSPDVFTDHLAKYPEFVVNGQLVDIQPLVERDGVPLDIYLEGLADLWVRDGGRYGLPKDWDTIAVVYNVQMLEDAGIDPAIMEDWTWNAEDGGTFGETIAQLQSAWSHWAASNGFVFNNGIWGDEYYYDDPALIETMQWFADLHLVHGFSPPLSDVTSLGIQAYFQSGATAMTTDGSWQIKNYVDNSPFEVGFGLLPVGPEGRKSMFNGLADSIWTGTQHLEESWQWVKFAASPECLNIVGAAGVVFPSTPEGVEISLQVRSDAGIDVSAYTIEAQTPGGTLLYPITDHGAEIAAIMTPAMDSIMLGEVSAEEALTAANAEVNALFD